MMTKNLISVAILALLTTSCISGAAEDNILLPSLQMAYPHIRADFDQGISVSSDQEALVEMMDSFAVALELGDKTALRMFNWPILAQYVELGISAQVASGAIAEGVAVVLRQRLENFTDGLNVLLGNATIALPTTRAFWYNTKHGTFYGGRAAKLETVR